uniref:Secreted protein n=1 Tax=Phakopsora pachyrhizi TaxID=170000 RepID=A0A0S1MKF4_PHAPC
MQSNFLLAFCLIAAVSVPVSRAHGVITSVEGANGQTGSAFGMVESTPRDGTRTNPFQTDSSIIRDREVSSGKASACGRTLAGGNNDIASDMSSVLDLTEKSE